MNQIIEEIASIGIVPVIKLNDAGKAVLLAQALKQGGIPCVEVTFRTSEAAQAIKNITDAMEDMVVGAGTVTTTQQVDRAIEAGAKFIVSPGFNEKIVMYCTEKDIPIVPGVLTPSEIERAVECGLKTLKFFPAEQGGGTAIIKALAGPYSGVRFMPTGGIKESNINDYLALDCVAACGGSFMAEPSLVDSDKYDEIEQICKNAVNKILGFSLKHVGINSSADEARKLADFFQETFGFEKKEGNSSIMAGNQIEVTKKVFPGTKGHISIGTNSIDRAIYHLERRGIKFNYDTIRKNDKGKIVVIYLKNEIGGFAIHLVKN